MMTGTLTFIRAVMGRDVLLALKSGGNWLHGIVFYAVFVAFMAFGLGPDANDLREAAGATLWLATLFAVQLAAADMFVSDLDDGSLQTLAVEQTSLLAYVVGKLLGILIIIGLPLIIGAPVMLIMFAVSPSEVLFAVPSLIAGVLALTLAALAASAINAALRGGGRFTAILAAPLSVPVLIFGIEASETAMKSTSLWATEFQLLLALTMFLSAVAPAFAALALRLGLE